MSIDMPFIIAVLLSSVCAYAMYCFFTAGE